MFQLSRRHISVPSLIIAGTLLAAGTLVAAGCGDTEKPTIATSYDLPASVKSLTVDGKVGEVNVTAKAGASTISVVEKRTDKAKPTHTASGSSATLKYGCPDNDFGTDCRVDYDITVPARVSVDVDNTAGKINLNGPLTEVVAKAQAGQIKGSDLGGGSFTATTDAGEIDLSFTRVPSLVKTNTKAGSTTITVPGAAKYQISASSSVGDEKVNVPSDKSAKNRIEAKADVGDITINKS